MQELLWLLEVEEAENHDKVPMLMEVLVAV
jgi:hypothetical protein